MTDLDFASLLCSRLCHDLMSPVGALGNGLELLADEQDPAMRERCLELVQDSVRATAGKLKFFRLAFGSGGGFGEEVPTAEARTALESLFGSDGKLQLGWLVADERLPKGAIKLLLNLAMIAGDALVRGGRLDVGAERSGDGIELVIRAEGPRLVLDPAVARTLVDGPGDRPVEPRGAPAWLAHSLAAQGAGAIRLSDPAEPVLLIGATVRA